MCRPFVVGIWLQPSGRQRVWRGDESARVRVSGGKFTVETSVGDFVITTDASGFVYDYDYALAHHATEFSQIDDPSALDFGIYHRMAGVGQVACLRGLNGYLLIKRVVAEPSGPSIRDVEFEARGSIEWTLEWTGVASRGLPCRVAPSENCNGATALNLAGRVTEAVAVADRFLLDWQYSPGLPLSTATAAVGTAALARARALLIPAEPASNPRSACACRGRRRSCQRLAESPSRELPAPPVPAVVACTRRPPQRADWCSQFCRPVTSTGLMIGNLVQNQFASARNWPFGSAASFILMGLVLAAVLVYLRMRDAAPAEH